MTSISLRGSMNLGAFFHPTGNHVAAWMHPEAQIDAGTNVEHYISIAQTAERGKFDMMFLADAVATRDGNLEALSRWPQYMAYFEPLTLLSATRAMASYTRRMDSLPPINWPQEFRSRASARSWRFSISADRSSRAVRRTLCTSSKSTGATKQ